MQAASAQALATAIARGCASSEISTGSYWGPDGRACTLAAAFLGIGGEHGFKIRAMLEQLYESFPVLDRRPYPEAKTLEQTIYALQDKRGKSRQFIAAWILKVGKLYK